MSVFKRFTTTVHARVDSLVRSIENHDALAEAALAQAHQRVAQARARLERLRREGAGIEENIAKIEEADAKWTRRAAAAKKDEEGLECLRRRMQCREQLTRLEQERATHTQTLARLQATLGEAERILQEQTSRYRLMRGREATAAARQTVEHLCAGGADSGLETIFERWEGKVLEKEFDLTPGEAAPDRFEHAFDRAEGEQALRAELEALRQQEGRHHE